MKPETNAKLLLGATRSKAKMYEYSVPVIDHIQMTQSPAKLLSLTISILGDYNRAHTAESREEVINEYRDNLLFVAQYFDAYVDSRTSQEFDEYFLLLGSVAYYLAGFPGSSIVLIKKEFQESQITLEPQNLIQLLKWLLLSAPESPLEFNSETVYDQQYSQLAALIKEYYLSGQGENEVIQLIQGLSNQIYSHGSDRELLVADMIKSVVTKKFENSSWTNLKDYSDLNIDLWKDALQKSSFIKEFWPSQKLLGKHGVYDGKSSIIQMPTSAGKTKSTELIIRSSFLSGRSDIALVIAPFRSLCSEIKNDLEEAFKGENVDIDVPSDSLQDDFDLFEEFEPETNKLVLILTPEKFLYILRLSPDVANEIGLIIYDEGHQFDNGIRGVTYELLLSSLKGQVSENTQVVLISAVISNAETIGEWLIQNDREVVQGKALLPTYRTIAFVNWSGDRGQLRFVKPDDPDQEEYFVPKVLVQESLPLRPRESKERFFPDKSDAKSIAIFLATKLIRNGPIAIFCGSKLIVKSYYEYILDLKSRDVDFQHILNLSNQDEVTKITQLQSDHFGEDSSIALSSSLGVFAHSGNTPEGIRHSIEYAMQNSLIKFVICTSTLAQGVNLPIKYLFVPSFYQAQQRISTRDFHNLIGRAGRSGIHTEGSIVFTDRLIFDQKDSWQGSWRWEFAKELLDDNKSEPCGSTLLKVFAPIYSDQRKYETPLDTIQLVTEYYNGEDSLNEFANSFVKKEDKDEYSISRIMNQFQFKIQIISAIESYLMAHWNHAEELENSDEEIANLVGTTLAYHLASEQDKNQLQELFMLVLSNLLEKANDISKRASFGRTLLGVQDSLDIESWTTENIEELDSETTGEGLLLKIWPIVYSKMTAQKIKKLTIDGAAYLVAEKWIQGSSYETIFNELTSRNVKIQAGLREQRLTLESIVDICENSFTYNAPLIIGAIREVVSFVDTEDEFIELIERLESLQKIVKYGLPDHLSIAFYEVGFSDRIIAQSLSENFPSFSSDYRNLISDLRRYRSIISARLEQYPAYFIYTLNTIVNS